MNGKLIKKLGVDERENGTLFFVVVDDRCKETLIALIQSRILPGSITCSDCWCENVL